MCLATKYLTETKVKLLKEFSAIDLIHPLLLRVNSSPNVALAENNLILNQLWLNHSI
jgi:hypothetical protein